MIHLASFIEGLGAFIVTWTWQAAIVLSIAWIAVALDRAHRPACRASVWAAALLVVLLLPVVPSALAMFPWSGLIRETYIPDIEISLTETAPGETGSAFVSNEFVPGSTEAVATAGLEPSLLHAAGLVWLLGVSIGASRRIAGHVRLRRLCADATETSVAELAGTRGDWSWIGKRAPRLLLSRRVATPMLYGWRRPVILLPHDVLQWSSLEERIAMIRHECAHLLRRDHWISGLDSLVVVTLFFHPLARLASRQWSVERELSCDDAVLKLGSDPECYGQAILKVAERMVRARVTAGVYFASAALLDRRIDMLFRTRPRQTSKGLFVIPASAMSTLMLAFGLTQSPVMDLLPPEIPLIGPPRNAPVRSARPIMAALPSALPPAPVEQRPPDRGAIRALVMAGRNLSEESVAAVEAQLQANPDALDTRLKLLGFYGRTPRLGQQQSRRQEHAIWLVRHHPEYVRALMEARLTPSDSRYGEAKQIWMRHLEQNSPDVYRNAAQYFRFIDTEFHEQILSKAESLWPAEVEWPRELGDHHMRQAVGIAKAQTAATAVAAYERALRSAANARDRNGLIGVLAEASFTAELWDKARVYALESSGAEDVNARHLGNWILGELALRSGDVQQAKNYLLASVPNSAASAFSYSGPRMRLAEELLKSGEVDAVLEYLLRCASIWPRGETQLRQWSILIQNGLTPDFGYNGR